MFTVRHGPGAAILPKAVRRVHLEFAFKINNGHMGARKFWRLYLPRLKYYNPAVLMTINRSTNQAGPPMLSIFFASDGEPCSASVNPSTLTSTAERLSLTDRVETFDMTHQHQLDILQQVMILTSAVDIQPTGDEILEMRQIEEDNVKSKQDRIRMQNVFEARKREKALLQQARGNLGNAAAMTAWSGQCVIVAIGSRPWAWNSRVCSSSMGSVSFAKAFQISIASKNYKLP